jgi:hypothetical protein
VYGVTPIEGSNPFLSANAVFFSMAPELADSASAKIVVLTPNADTREILKHRLRTAVSDGLAPEAFAHVTQFVFGPPTPFPVEFRVMGPHTANLYGISEQALSHHAARPRRPGGQPRLGDRTPVVRSTPR